MKTRMTFSEDFLSGSSLRCLLLLLFLVDEGWEDPNAIISGPSSARKRADDGPTLNVGLVAS